MQNKIPAAIAPMVYTEQLQFSDMSLISIISFSFFLIFLVIVHSPFKSNFGRFCFTESVSLYFYYSTHYVS